MEPVKGISIDGATTRDIDDALYLEDLPGGGRLITVCVPDLRDAVPVGGHVDIDARRKGWSRYRGPRLVESMLPRTLTDRHALTPGREKAAVAFRMRLDADFALLDYKVEPVRFLNVGRLTYEQADQGRVPNEYVAGQLKAVLAAGSELYHKRTGRLFGEDGADYLDEEGNVLEPLGDLSHLSHVAIAELMILTNACAALWAQHHGLPLLWREHGPRPVGNGMTMGRAVSTASPAPHQGLGLPAYSWVTSPLRRYADLVNQRLLLGGEAPDLQALAKHLNDVEDRLRSEKDEIHDRVSYALAQRAINSGDLSAVERHVLRRAINLAREQAAAIPLVAAEVRGRLARQDLTEREIMHIIDARPSAISDLLIFDIASHLRTRPGAAWRVFNRLHSMGECPRPVLQSMEIGAGLHRVICSLGDGDDPLRSAICVGAPDDAERRALTSLLGRLLELPAEALLGDCDDPENGMALKPAHSQLSQFSQEEGVFFDVDVRVDTSTSDRAYAARAIFGNDEGEWVTAESRSLAREEACIRWLADRGITREYEPFTAPAQVPAQAAEVSNPIGQLQEWITRHKLPLPTYAAATPYECGYGCEVIYACLDGTWRKAVGFGDNPKAAKAAAALEAMEAKDLPVTEDNIAEPPQQILSSCGGDNPVGRLLDWFQKQHLVLPDFTMRATDSGEMHCTLEMQLSDGSILSTSAKGLNKRQAKRDAAEAALQAIAAHEAVMRPRM